jgi:nucleoside-diphosphate-sugar epimerase
LTPDPPGFFALICRGKQLIGTVHRAWSSALWGGDLVFDTTKPDGTPRKLLDVSRITALGWQAKMPLREGIRRTVEEYRTAHT